MTKTPDTTYGLYTEDGLDQIAYGRREAKREAKDLRAMDVGTVQVICIKGKGDHDAVYDWLHENVRYGLTRKVSKSLITKAPKNGLSVNLMSPSDI